MNSPGGRNLGNNQSTLSNSFNVSKNYEFHEEQDQCLQVFDRWAPMEQTEFVENLLRRMCHFQHGHINNFLKPMLQRDFISSLPAKGLLSIAEIILSYLDAKSLCAAELVCREWLRVISEGMLWKKLIEQQVETDPMWKGLSVHRGWAKYLYKNNPFYRSNLSLYEQSKFYKELYLRILKDKEQVNQNWSEGKCQIKKIHCRSENSKGVYCLQYDNEKIVSGLRDNTIKVWNKQTCECKQTLSGHTGSVLCLQYDKNIIVSGSSDTTVRVWDINTGQNVQTLHNHKEAVLHLRFMDGLMVTCSKDRQIIVWDMHSPNDIQIRRTLVGHRAAVNVVDFDNRYIVSASGDRTIKVWLTSTCEFVRTLTGHKRGIACLQYKGNLVVSGSSDFTIRLWDIECGECLRILEGHDELVRCIRFDNKRIVSGAYDGKIKIWDLKSAMEQRPAASTLCMQTLTEHTGRVFRLQFDEFQIVSSSHDDSIIIWDFLNYHMQSDAFIEFLDKYVKEMTSPSSSANTSLVSNNNTTLTSVNQRSLLNSFNRNSLASGGIMWPGSSNTNMFVNKDSLVNNNTNNVNMNNMNNDNDNENLSEDED